jgi:hypothetical protein
MSPELRQAYIDNIKEILVKGPALSIEQLAEIILKEIVCAAVEEEKSHWIKFMFTKKKKDGFN